MSEQPDIFADERNDDLWHLDHSRRRFRVRLWRPHDGARAGEIPPHITILDFRTKQIWGGIPVAWIGPDDWQDTDAYALGVLSMLPELRIRHKSTL